VPITSSPPPLNNAKRSNTSRASSSPKKTVKEERTEAINGLGQLAQAPLLATKQYADAGAIGVHWNGIAEEIAGLAESQPAIANVIDPLIKIGPYTGLVMAILPFFAQIAVNHGRIAAGAMGTVPGNSLAAQIEASLAQAEMEALAAQLAAERAAQQLRDEIKRARKDMMNAQASQVAVVE
jgi:hypothetical protein